MSRLPPRLRKLDRLLLDLPDDGGPMLVSELDGYIAGLLQLLAIARDDGTLPNEAINPSDDTAPDLIPRWVLALNARRVANAAGVPAPVPSLGKVGRNDTCPRSSSKKY